MPGGAAPGYCASMPVPVTVANVYLALYPKPILAGAMQADRALARKVWTVLNGICPKAMLGEGRVYGGGLHKLEPGELANVPAPEIAALLPDQTIPRKQVEMFTHKEVA